MAEENVQAEEEVNEPAAAEATEEKAAEVEELVGGVKKQPTAQDLLKEEIGDLKIRKLRAVRMLLPALRKLALLSITRLSRSLTLRETPSLGPAPAR
jgi:small subunit ribosomal protein S11